MPKDKPATPGTPVTPVGPNPPAVRPPVSGSDQTQLFQAPGVTVPAVPVDTGIPQAKASTAAETKPVDLKLPMVPPPTRPSYAWIMIPVALAFILVLIILGTLSRPKTIGQQTGSGEVEEKSDLRNYSEFVAKNRELIESQYSEQVLTDEPFAGQAPLDAKDSGPLLSEESDPQAAALVDAFRIRVQLMQGSQEIIRNNMVSRVVRGDLRGFKVHAVEKLENGKLVSEEVILTTPKNGLIKTVGRVLDSIQRTDFPGLVSEVKDAGMEFMPLPVPHGEKTLRAQLRFVRPWGKPLPGEWLISGNSVGGITLGMPVGQIKNKLAASRGILKRKVRVNERYYDVYKVTDQDNVPLFYVYEKVGNVWGISVVSEAFKTKKGIGIGTPLDMIRVLYSSVKLAHSEQKPPFVQVDGVAGIFIIQGDGGEKVISILIGDSPEFE